MEMASACSMLAVRRCSFRPMRGPVGMAEDGTLSAGGAPIAQVGLWLPADPLCRAPSVRNAVRRRMPWNRQRVAKVFQGFLEESNVNPISEIARMIEVQRAYELGQKFLDAEDGRARSVIETLGR